MEDLLNMSDGQNTTAMVIFSFLQADSSSTDYNKELHSLGSELNLTRDINYNGSRIDSTDDGDLETDGHPMSSPLRFVNDIRPSADVHWPIGNHEAAAAPQRIAEELRLIGDQLEHGAVARATRNLSANLSASNSEQWHVHLSREVQWVMRNIGLPQHLHHEQVMVALTLTLVKGVCQQSPQFLKNLFNATLQCILGRTN